MLTLALRYWQFIVGFAAASILAFMLHSLDVNRIEKNKEAEKQAAVTAVTAQCIDNQKLTEGINNDQQSRLSELDKRYNAAVKRLQQTCVHVTPTPSQPRADTAGLPAGDGIETGYLLTFAYRADQNTARLITCNKFLDEVYGTRKP